MADDDNFDFDAVIDREGTGSVKWEFHTHGGFSQWQRARRDQGDDRVLAMWVADMDFRCPPPVLAALRKRVDHGIFGYSARTDAYSDVVCDWFRRRQGWTIDADWLLTVPGVVPTLNICVRAFTEPGDRVIVQRPVYYPFFKVTANNDCEILSNALVLDDDGYRMDLDDLEAKARDPRARLFILCSPHNPVGKVWGADDLRAVAEICARHGVIVIADEIHGDLLFPGAEFTPFATLGDTAAQNAIICTAPSKTFNLAGLHTSNIIIPNPELRQCFAEAHTRQSLSPGMNPFGIAATMAAYRDGEPWLDAVMRYIAGNADRLIAFFDQELPEIRAFRPEGTYLQWFDCRAFGLGPEALEDLMLNKAGVYFDEGYIFGEEGAGFERINLACPRRLLDDALVRIRDAFRSL